MFSQTQEYALRAVVWLAGHMDETPVGHRRIAECTAVPTSYLSKVLQALTRAEILESRRGVGGGFRLTREPDKLSVLEVINAVDPIERIKTCPLGLETHGTHLCPMHARLDGAMKLVIDVLGSSTISDVLSERGRPLPLVEMIGHPESTNTTDQVDH